MIGYLLGTANKKTVLVTIEFNKKKSNITKNHIIDKENATYLSSNYKIIDIVDEFLNKYISVDLQIILNEKFIEIHNLKLNELNEKKLIFFYLNKKRALQDIYLFNSKCTGIFKQYLINGQIHGIISLKNGYLNGINKTYENGFLVKECEYKHNQENGLCKKYDNSGTLLEVTNWKSGILIKV
jgi:antitoxin component YwqK of YwqJK toxin-antitoxin module